MTEDSINRCRTCKVWLSSGLETHPGVYAGVCRLTPPQLTKPVSYTEQEDGPEPGFWPGTMDNDWCGCHTDGQPWRVSTTEMAKEVTKASLREMGEMAEKARAFDRHEGTG